MWRLWLSGLDADFLPTIGEQLIAAMILDRGNEPDQINIIQG